MVHGSRGRCRYQVLREHAGKKRGNRLGGFKIMGTTRRSIEVQCA